MLLQVLQALVERRDLSEELTQEALKVRRAVNLGANLVLREVCCTHKCSACSNYWKTVSRHNWLLSWCSYRPRCVQSLFCTAWTVDRLRGADGMWLDGLNSDEQGQTPSEIAGLARAMREKCVPVFAGPDVLDIVGTGGDGIGSVNISTGMLSHL